MNVIEILCYIASILISLIIVITTGIILIPNPAACAVSAFFISFASTSVCLRLADFLNKLNAKE